MNHRLCLAFALSSAFLSSAVCAQTVQGQAGGSATFPNPAFQPAPAYYPTPKPLENIGRTGQFIFGMERITGFFIDRETVSYKDPVTRATQDFTFKSTSFGLLGVDSRSPSALPRFALDYVVYQGFTAGGSLMLSTRAMSLSGDASGQRPAPPPSANDDGLTLFGTARVGYAYAFDSTFAIWPRVGLAYVQSSARREQRNPTDGKSLGSFEYKSNFGSANLELLGAISPIEHIVVTGGPYLDYGFTGGYSVLQDSTEIDHRDARFTSFGFLINAAGYY